MSPVFVCLSVHRVAPCAIVFRPVGTIYILVLKGRHITALGENPTNERTPYNSIGFYPVEQWTEPYE